ncbi:desmoplakin [Clostera anastomosis granulovirus A]|uniref:Desmoplakin n=1 Tax=Clostera anastomosis granulovirus A TaxID=1986289 RepID=U5KB70_9BBAC|nr:desmoplakin [Clostera anastomosis granulovirus Henan]AGQ20356.1 desmoplakin [Clostera anastomosis granulovirus Henan]
MNFNGVSSVNSSALLLSDDMILTRYRGVDVTPHTFNNLMKTIASQRSISNTSQNKTKFEERIREIILAFNPSLKNSSRDMTTEYLLINSLKLNDKKQITHTYNYNTWGKDTRVDDNSERDQDDDDDDDDFKTKVVEAFSEMAHSEWDEVRLFDLVRSVSGKQCAKKVKRAYERRVRNERADACPKKSRLVSSRDDADNGTLTSTLKNILGIKKLDVEGCCSLVGAMKRFIDRWIEEQSMDTIEKYVYALRQVDEKLRSVEGVRAQMVATHEQDMSKLVNELRELQDVVIAHANCDRELNRVVTNCEGLTKRVEAVTKLNDDLNTTITHNVIEMAKLCADVGEKEVTIEELSECVNRNSREMSDLRNKVAEMDAKSTHVISECTQLDEQNTLLLSENSKLESRVVELEAELRRVLDSARVGEARCYELLNGRDKDDEERQRVIDLTSKLCSDLRKENEVLLQDKHAMTRQLEEVKEFNKNLKQRMDVDARQNQDQHDMLEQKLVHSERELSACRGRLADREQEYNIKLHDHVQQITRLTSDVEELKQTKRRLETDNAVLSKDNENLKLIYEEGCDAIEREADVRAENKRLKARVDDMLNEFENERADWVNKVNDQADSSDASFDATACSSVRPEKRKHDIMSKIAGAVKPLRKPDEVVRKQRKSVHVLPIKNSSFVTPHVNKQ